MSDAAGKATFAYSPQGRTASVTSAAGSTVSYVDDAEGNILVRSDPGTTTLYLPGEELTRTTSSGVIVGTRYYSHAGVTVAVRVGRTPDSMLFADPGGTADVSVVETTTGSGTPVRRHLDPYGTVLTAGTGTWPDTHGFLNKPADPTTGLSDLGAREYDPALGRFMSVDPLLETGDPQALNGYAYADNNPVTEEDPTGKDAYSQETPCGDIDCGVSNGDQAPTASPLNTTQNNPGHDWSDRNCNANPVECRASSTGAPTYFKFRVKQQPRPANAWSPRPGYCVGRACQEIQASQSLGSACNAAHPGSGNFGSCDEPALQGLLIFVPGPGPLVGKAGEALAEYLPDVVTSYLSVYGGYVVDTARSAASDALNPFGITTMYLEGTGENFAQAGEFLDAAGDVIGGTSIPGAVSTAVAVVANVAKVASGAIDHYLG